MPCQPPQPQDLRYAREQLKSLENCGNLEAFIADCYRSGFHDGYREGRIFYMQDSQKKLQEIRRILEEE